MEFLSTFFLSLSPIFTTKENETEIEKIKSNQFPGNEEKVKHSRAIEVQGRETKWNLKLVSPQPPYGS